MEIPCILGDVKYKDHLSISAPTYGFVCSITRDRYNSRILIRYQTYTIFYLRSLIKKQPQLNYEVISDLRHFKKLIKRIKLKGIYQDPCRIYE